MSDDDAEELQNARWFLEAHGYRRCDIAACNCPYWHGGNAERRLLEIHDAIVDAGHDINGITILGGVQAILSDYERMRAELAMRQAHGEALQRIGTALGLPAGADLHTECVPAIKALSAELATLRRNIRECADDLGRLI